MNNSMKLIMAGALIGGSVWADDLITDRPDATESSSTVAPGKTQVEIGWLYSESGSEGTLEVPQTLLRIGLVDFAELRIGWGGYVDADGGVGDGAADGELGTKIFLMEEEGLLPESALLMSISVPWGESGVSSEEVDPGFRFSMSHTLSETLSLGYNLGAEWETEDDSTLSSFIYTIALGASLTENWGAYIESFGDVGLSASGSSHSLDGGLTYLLNENLQLDVLAGVGLSDDADDWFVGSGVSYRFPN